MIAIENVRLFKVLDARTEALTRSVGQLTALGEVGQAVSSTLDLEIVLKTIVSRAVQITGLDGGSIYEYDERAEEFRLQAAENMPQDVTESIRSAPTRKGDGALGRTAITLEPTQVPDTLDDSYQSVRKELLLRAGYRALLAVPLLCEGRLLGGLLVNRNDAGGVRAGDRRTAQDIRHAVGARDPECAAVPRDRGERPAARRRRAGTSRNSSPA